MEEDGVDERELGSDSEEDTEEMVVEGAFEGLLREDSEKKKSVSERTGKSKKCKRNKE